MILKWLGVIVIFYKVNSFGCYGEPWDDIVGTINNLEKSRLSRQKSSKSYVSNPLVSTIEIPASVFPDVTYPTTILDTREPYYFTTNAFDDVLKPFSHDVISSYKALQSGKVQTTSSNNVPVIPKNNNKTIGANATLNTCNELQEPNKTEYEKDRLVDRDLIDMTQDFDHEKHEETCATNYTEIPLDTEILEQSIQNTGENLTPIYFNKLPSTYSDQGAIAELYTEGNGNFETEYPNKLNEARNMFNIIRTTLQNFQKPGTCLPNNELHNGYNDTTLLVIEIKNDENKDNITKSKHEFDLNSNDHKKSNISIKEKLAASQSNNINCTPLEGITQPDFEKDENEGSSSSSSDENEIIHIYVANENTSDYEIVEILIDNSEETNVKSAANSLSIFDF